MFTEFAGAGKYGKNKKTGHNTIEGVVTFPGGKFEDVRIDGVCTSNGNIEANRIDANGVFTVNGDVLADSIDCDGVVTIRGNLRVKRADIDGVTTVQGDKIEADYIYCDGVLTAENQVSADVIEADGFINAREIVGDRIYIKSIRRSVFFKFFLAVKEVFKSDFSQVNLIEATQVELRGVRAKVVNGHEVIIGPGCIIERVDCSGILRIDPSAQVGEVVGAAAQQV